MPRNFSELKSGGTIPMLSPHTEKWGDAYPRPPPIDARVNKDVLLSYTCNSFNCSCTWLRFVYNSRCIYTPMQYIS